MKHLMKVLPFRTDVPLRKAPGLLRGLLLSALLVFGVAAGAQAQAGPLSAPELDHLVSRIALYPDPLLAQALTASTYPEVIPAAATWADQHSNIKGDALAQA